MNTRSHWFSPARATGALLVALTLFGAACACDSDPRSGPRGEAPSREAESQARAILKVFDRFQGRLKPELKAAIAAGGTAGAIDRCHTVSPELAQQMSRTFAKEARAKFTVRRVSDRPRNSANAPDGFEAKILEQWLGDLAAGRELQAVVRETDEGLRVMKPIRAQGMCLACHGQAGAIEAATRARLRSLYPEDRALGYQAGDLRGAFSAVLGPERP
ncbi:MAG: DUF3365 domain-containing protein [bacterium]|nr:DUF3365 domain-containing protein [bacterium]